MRSDDELRADDDYPQLAITARKVLLAKQEAAGAGQSSGWLDDIDIATLQDPEPPSMFVRDDGKGYGYPGALHLLYGSREAGKTWFAAVWAAQEMQRGRGVLWFAFEHQQGMRERLSIAGGDLAPAAASSPPGRFRYRVASGRPSSDDISALAATIARERVSLVVFDAMRGLMSAFHPSGADSNNGDAVELVNSGILVPLCRAGAAVLVIDHRPKGGTTAFGSERKESMADVVLSAESVETFDRESPGWSKVTATKDRYGWIGHSSPGYLCMVPGELAAFSECDLSQKDTTGKFIPKMTPVDYVANAVRAREEAVKAGQCDPKTGQPLVYHTARTVCAELANNEALVNGRPRSETWWRDPVKTALEALRIYDDEPAPRNGKYLRIKPAEQRQQEMNRPHHEGSVPGLDPAQEALLAIVTAQVNREAADE